MRGVATVGLTGLVATCVVLSTLSVRGLRAPAPDLDAMVSGMAAAAVAAVLTLWCCGAALTAAAIVVRATGRASTGLDALSRATTPGVVRRLVAVALGAGVIGGVTGPALAAQPPSGVGWPAAGTSTASAPDADLDPDADADPAAAEVVVRLGDTLWGITAAALPAGATARDVAGAWPDWYRANRAVIGNDPGLIRPGQHLSAPPTTAITPSQP